MTVHALAQLLLTSPVSKPKLLLLRADAVVSCIVAFHSARWLRVCSLRILVDRIDFGFLDMGIGVDWPVPATSWTQNNFTNMCVNSCFELYGDPDPEHFPSSGSDVRPSFSAPCRVFS